MGLLSVLYRLFCFATNLASINYYDMNLGRSREIHFSSQEKEEGALDILCVRGYPLP